MPSKAEILADLPQSVAISAKQVYEAREAANDHLVYVVLDDDPTGTQSVADLPVLTAWEEPDFAWAFSTGKAAIYVMTNSRSLSPEDAKTVNQEVVRSALNAAHKAGVRVSFISRSDSTLRGHFPLEPLTIDAEIRTATGRSADGIVVVPSFEDAGRITVNGIHYAGSDDSGYVPVGKTEFAHDATFGYRNSYLPKWVEEKSDGTISAESVLLIDLATLRTDHDGVVTTLRSAHDAQVIVVDIVEESDLRLLSLALIEAESAGSNFIYRVGPPFPRARIGQDVHSPVTSEEIAASRAEREFAPHGLIVIGSHVALTTRQLAGLRRRNAPQEFELDVARVLADDGETYLADLAKEAAEALNDGNVVVETSRTLVKGNDADESLAISRRVSAAMVSVTRQILALNAPRFVVAKGGITSSDTASKGLGIRHAMVIGPMLPGIVSLWSGHDGAGAGIPYVVFPGNVGDDESLADVVEKLA